MEHSAHTFDAKKAAHRDEENVASLHTHRLTERNARPPVASSAPMLHAPHGPCGDVRRHELEIMITKAHAWISVVKGKTVTSLESSTIRIRKRALLANYAKLPKWRCGYRHQMDRGYAWSKFPCSQLVSTIFTAH
jgi:hypothetical protein